MPARSTIFLWLEKHEEFAKWYTLAKRMQIEDLLDALHQRRHGPVPEQRTRAGKAVIAAHMRDAEMIGGRTAGCRKPIDDSETTEPR